MCSEAISNKIQLAVYGISLHEQGTKKGASLHQTHTHVQSSHNRMFCCGMQIICGCCNYASQSHTTAVTVYDTYRDATNQISSACMFANKRTSVLWPGAADNRMNICIYTWWTLLRATPTWGHRRVSGLTNVLRAMGTADLVCTIIQRWLVFWIVHFSHDAHLCVHWKLYYEKLILINMYMWY